MSIDFNVSHIPYRFYCDKLSSLDQCNNLIIESSANNIEFKTNNKDISFNNTTIFNYGLNMNDKDLSNIHTIRGNILNIDTLFLRDISASLNNIIDNKSIEDGYIRATTIGYNPAEPNIIGAKDGYFTYINVSGGDSSFNNSVYIKNKFDVSGSTTISNDLIVNRISYVTLYNSINNYIASIGRDLSTAKIVTKDLSASNISISNNLVVAKTSFINDLSISGHLLDNILKVPHDFTIDPSPHDDASGTLIINGDLIVYGNRTIISSSIVEISDITLSVATNLTISNDLYRNNAGLDISNVASLKYDGINWNFEGGQLSVENKKVGFDASLTVLKNSVQEHLNILNSSFDLSYSQLKQNMDNSFNLIYTKSQIDNSFLLINYLDNSLNNYQSYVDNSYVSKLAFDASFNTLQTYLDASYIIKGTISNPNVIDSSLIFLNNKLDLSYVSKSFFDDSYNNLKRQIDNSFASISLTSLDTSSISIETINTKHYSRIFNNSSWNQIGLDLSNGGPFNNNYNKVAISNDGKVVAYSKLYSVLNPTQVEQAVTNWTNRTIPSAFSSGSGGIADVEWSSYLQLFVAVGFGNDSNNTRALWSSDGTNWNSATMNSRIGTGGRTCVCWSPERRIFVSLAGEGSQFNDTKAMTSTDGKNWTERTIPSTIRDAWFADVCWSPQLGIFVAIADTGNYKIMTSLDGISWTVILSSNVIARLSGICWSAQLGIFVAINLFGSEVYTSKDGSSWTKYAFPQEVISTYKQSICWSPQLELFVAVGSAGTYRIITSRNGTDWTPVYNMANQGGNLFFVDWIPALNLFIALTTSSNDVAVITSPNGVNWTPRTSAPSNGGWMSCAWSSELRILVAGGAPATGYTGLGKIMTSSVTTPFVLENNGRVYVYELSYNQASSTWNQLGLSSEIIVGLSNEDNFGWDIALSNNGRIVAGSSIASDASGFNCGQVRLFELSNNNRWVKKGSDINGPRVGSESGTSISLAGSGNSIAIGSWRDNSNGANAGAVRVYDFSANINDWRQKGQTIAGVSGSSEGYVTALSLDGQTLAITSNSEVTATGGTITNVNEYIIHSFTNVGITVFTINNPITIEYLVIAGGGSGGRGGAAGGGGGGGVLSGTASLMPGSYNITVGAGGISATKDKPGNNGGSSSISDLIVTTGGGGGGGWDVRSGLNGGSGGGASAAGTLAGGSGIAGQGFAGSARLDSVTGGGGGGAGAAASGKNGAIGIISSITGTTKYYAGGGGASAFQSSALGVAFGGIYRTSYGTYGGGNGAYAPTNTIEPYQDGQPNTGGGGGGSEGHDGISGAGGSGIVVIRYLRQYNIIKPDVKTFTWSGTSWIPKGIIIGPLVNNSNFGKSIKLSANGNTIVIGSPETNILNLINTTTTTGWTYNAWTDDSSIGLEPNFNYTVAVNLGGDLAIATTINNVPFQAFASSGTNFSIVGGPGVATSTSNNISGASRNLANDFIYGSDVYTVTLTNLIVGKKYQTTFFSLAWDAGGSTARNQTFSTTPSASILINPNIYGFNNGIVIKYTFIAGSSTQVFTITASGSSGYTFHFYALANVLLDKSEEITGRALVYEHQGGTTWTQIGQTLLGISGGNEFGSSVNMSNDGTIISVGTNDISSNRGYVNVYKYVNNYWRQISNSLNGNVATFKSGLHALNGDGTTLIQSNNSYYSVYGINKLLALNSPATSISGNLIVLGTTAFNSLDISINHSYSSNGYSYKVFESPLTSAIMKEYYSDVTSTRHLKVQILGNGDITNRNNSYRSLSDSRLKENIVTCGPKLEDLLKVRVVNYNLKGSNSTKYIGVLAQELEELFPNLVTEIEPSPKDVEEGRLIKYKAVNYSSFDALLIKSLQEQNAMLKNIAQRLETLEEALEDDD